MSNMNESQNMWVYIETECGKAKTVGFELLNAARPLADKKGCELWLAAFFSGQWPVVSGQCRGRRPRRPGRESQCLQNHEKTADSAI